MTLSRLATAKLMTTIASGRRISAVKTLRIMTSGGFTVEALAHFLAGLDKGHRLLVHRDMRPGVREAFRATRPVVAGACCGAAQLHRGVAPRRRPQLAGAMAFP